MPLSWSNDNAGRAYPLRQDQTPALTHSVTALTHGLPTTVLVDAQFLMGGDAPWSRDGGRVALRRITRTADGFTVAVAATDLPDLEFAVPAALPEYGVVTAEEPTVGTEVPDVLWEGVLSIGRLDALEALLAVGETLEAIDLDQTRFEPALIQELGPRLRSINLANMPRLTTADAALPDPATVDAVVVARGLTGDVRLLDGYNAALRTLARDGALEFGAGVGAGAGEPPGEVPTHDGETSPDASGLLSGGPGCKDVILAVNGLSARNLRFQAGAGLVIRPDPDDPHGLLLDLLAPED